MAGKVFILGLGELRSDTKEAEQKIRPELRKNLELASQLVVGATGHQFRGSRTRAKYMIRGGRRVRRKPPGIVTAPPHMLARFEGYYARAISYTVSQAGNKLTSEVGPVAVAYARRHEFGTLGMPRRPVLTPAVEQTEKQVFALLERSFRVLP